MGASILQTGLCQHHALRAEELYCCRIPAANGADRLYLQGTGGFYLQGTGGLYLQGTGGLFKGEPVVFVADYRFTGSWLKYLCYN